MEKPVDDAGSVEVLESENEFSDVLPCPFNGKAAHSLQQRVQVAA